MTTSEIIVARTGVYHDANGAPHVFGEADLAALVAGYDADREPAPVVIGAPKLDDPAWGWVDRLRVTGNAVVASIAHVPQLFRDAVKAKRYPRVAASFYPPAHPSNPRPDRFYLKHIAFMGGEPLPSPHKAVPAVPRLKPAVAFADAGAVAFAEPAEQIVYFAQPAPAFVAPPGYTLADHRADILARAKQIGAANRGARFMDAYRAAEAEASAMAAVARAEPADQAAAQLLARITQIQADNLGASSSAALTAALQEAEALAAVASASPADKPEAVLMARTRQIEAKRLGIGFRAAYRAAVEEAGAIRAAEAASPDDQAHAALYARAKQHQADNPTASFAEALSFAGKGA